MQSLEPLKQKQKIIILVCVCVCVCVLPGMHIRVCVRMTIIADTCATIMQ